MSLMLMGNALMNSKSKFSPANRWNAGADSLDIKEDPQLKALADRTKNIAAEQRKQADTFKAQSGELKGKRYNIQGDSLRRDLAQNIAGTRQQANRQGLLYSGMREGQETGLRGALPGQLAEAQSGINREVDEEAKNMAAEALQGELQAANVDQQLKNDLYQRQLQAREAYIGRMGPLAGPIRGAVYS